MNEQSKLFLVWKDKITKAISHEQLIEKTFRNFFSLGLEQLTSMEFDNFDAATENGALINTRYPSHT